MLVTSESVYVCVNKSASSTSIVFQRNIEGNLKKIKYYAHPASVVTALKSNCSCTLWTSIM